MDIIDNLFLDTNAVGSREVARAFDLSEQEARQWADELSVAKIGASFAWTRVEVEALVAELEASQDDAEDEPDEGEDDENDEDETDGDGDEE